MPIEKLCVRCARRAAERFASTYCAPCWEDITGDPRETPHHFPAGHPFTVQREARVEFFAHRAARQEPLFDDVPSHLYADLDLATEIQLRDKATRFYVKGHTCRQWGKKNRGREARGEGRDAWSVKHGT